MSSVLPWVARYCAEVLVVLEAAAIVILAFREEARREALTAVCRAVEALDADECVKLKIVKDSIGSLSPVHPDGLHAAARYVKRYVYHNLNGLAATMLHGLIKREIEGGKRL